MNKDMATVKELAKSQPQSPIGMAYAFAEKAHSRQKRESGEPYFNHVLATAEILPVCGREEESLRIVCDEACVDVCTGSSHLWSVRGYQGGKLMFEKDETPGEPLDIQNGTYYETEAFLLAVLEGKRLPAPSIPDALIASELAEEMMRAK